MKKIFADDAHVECYRYLKTNKQFQWEDIKCRKRECIDGTSYIFSIDKEIKLGVNKINFYFAMEDFFDKMSKKCIIT
ncbi:MAG: hypothetical protein IKQ13_03915 [Treponema sp.]|nr:hypothetical protein [Treponema sp.]